MKISRRNQFVLLAALAALLVVVLYLNSHRPAEISGVSSADEKFQPLSIESPKLRIDLLEGIKKAEYAGPHRNIFSASLPPPPQPQVQPVAIGPAAPPPPLPLVVPVKFFGYATDPQNGRRRAFFTDGEDVYIVGEGETLLVRFRVLRIGNSNADVEEIASGRRATLVLEELGPSA